MRNIKESINNYFFIIGAQVISVPLSLFYLSFISRIMGPNTYGQFVIFLSVAQLFFSLFINWNKNATIRFASEEFAKTKRINRIFYIQVLMILISILSMSLVIILFRNNITAFTGLSSNIFLYITIYLFVFSISEYSVHLLQATHLMRRYAFALIARQILVILSVLFFYILKKGLNTINVINAELFSNAFTVFLVALPMFKMNFFQPFIIEKGLLRKVMLYSRPFIILYFLGYLSTWSDALLIRKFMDFKSVGIYELANRLMQSVSNLIMSISIVGFPIIVSLRVKSREDLIFRYAQRVIPQVCFFWSFFIMLLLFFTNIFFKAIFGIQYLESIKVFEVLLIGLSFQILSVMYTSLIQTYDLNNRLVFISIVTITINILGDILLLPRIGIIGAAISRTTSMIICGILYMMVAVRGIDIKNSNYKKSLILLIFPLLLLFVSVIMLGRVIDRLFLAIAAIIILYITVKRLGIFDESDIAYVDSLSIPNNFKRLVKAVYYRFS